MLGINIKHDHYKTFEFILYVKVIILVHFYCKNMRIKVTIMFLLRYTF
jgi:hypothetical protein